jgi:hypothetical protein
MQAVIDICLHKHQDGRCHYGKEKEEVTPGQYQIIDPQEYSCNQSKNRSLKKSSVDIVEIALAQEITAYSSKPPALMQIRLVFT